MRTNFLNKVAAMSGKNVNELVGMSQSEVVNKVILPINRPDKISAAGASETTICH